MSVLLPSNQSKGVAFDLQLQNQKRIISAQLVEMNAKFNEFKLHVWPTLTSIEKRTAWNMRNVAKIKFIKKIRLALA